jgi:uncharacterized Tic20 family protein
MPRRDDDDDYEDDYDDRPRRRRLEPHRGQTILILGVVAIAFMHLLGPFVWWMGAVDLKKMREGVMDPRGESDTRLGYILGIISTILVGISLLILIVFFVMFLFGLGMFAVAAAGAAK